MASSKKTTLNSGDEQDRRSRVPVRQQQKEFTRRLLLDAALETFLEKGYVATRIEDIVSAAGASRATFYLHFDGKADLLTALRAPARSEIIDLYGRLAAAESLTRAEISEWLGETVDFFERHRALLSVTNEAVASEPELSREYFTRTEKLIDRIAVAVASGIGHSEEEARLRAAVLVVGLERFCQFWIVRRMDFDREMVLKTLTELWWSELTRPSIAG